MANQEILSTYTAPELKKLISATNIKGYSKLKKEGLIKLMLREEHVDKFKSIKKKEMRTGDPKEKEAKAKKKLLKEFKKRAKPAVKAFEFKEDQKKLTEAIEKKFPKKKEEELKPKRKRLVIKKKKGEETNEERVSKAIEEARNKNTNQEKIQALQKLFDAGDIKLSMDKSPAKPKAKKERSDKQKANDKRLGEQAKARAKKAK